MSTSVSGRGGLWTAAMAELEAGLTSERTYTVTDEMTAATLAQRDLAGGPALPPVWSTPDMIARMELTAAAMVAPLLPPGQITVGARNEIGHLGATPVGMQVRVVATLAAVEGRKLVFTVEAFDAREKVGEGVHIRYIVDRAKFDARLAAK